MLASGDALGHWVGDGVEGAKFWTSVLGELQARGVKDILIACMDGLTGFPDAVHAVFPKTVVQRCIVHQIRNSLKYVVYKDQDAFLRDLKAVYQAPARDQAETALPHLGRPGATNILAPSNPGKPTGPNCPPSSTSRRKFDA